MSTRPLRDLLTKDSRAPDRLRSRIVINENECWIWQGSTTRGYGTMRVAGVDVYVHRVSYEAFVGEIPKGLQIDHLCRVPRCVNPEHLEPVTNAENHRRIPRRTHCPLGHPYDEENTGWIHHEGRSWKRCLTCHRAREAARAGGYRPDCAEPSCSKRSLRDSAFCYAHAPERQAEREAHLVAARSRITKHTPRRFDHDEARRLHAGGMTLRAIAKQMGVSYSRVQRICP